MINSWAAAAQAMINKNADYRLRGRWRAQPDGRRGRWRATGPRSGADTGALSALRPRVARPAPVCLLVCLSVGARPDTLPD